MARFRNPIRFLTFASSVLFTALSTCRADVVISVENILSEAGKTVMLGVFASSETGDEITGFNLPIDFNSDGRNDVLPPGFTISSSPAHSTYTQTDFDRNPILFFIDADVIANGSGQPVKLGNSLQPTRLFNIVIDIAPNVAPGTVLPFQIIVPPIPGIFNISTSAFVQAPTLGNPATGSVTIFATAVPEPNTLALIALGGVLFLRKRRLRKNKALRDRRRIR